MTAEFLINGRHFPLKPSFRCLFQSQDLLQKTRQFQKWSLQLQQETAPARGNQNNSQNSCPFLYLHQREKITFSPGKFVPNQFDSLLVASAEATTCCIVGIQTSAGVISMAHVDGSKDQLREDASCAVYKMMMETIELSLALLKEQNSKEKQDVEKPVPLDVYLYLSGSFQEKESEKNVSGIYSSLRSFLMDHDSRTVENSNQYHLRCHLECFSVLEWNTRKDGFPISTSMAFYWSRHRSPPYQAFPISNLSLSLMGFEYESRGVRGFMGESHLEQLFDHNASSIRVGPFKYEVMPPMYALQFLQMEDDQLIQYASTSPSFESELFIPSFKRYLKFMLEHPDSEEYFHNHQEQRHFTVEDLPLVNGQSVIDRLE